MPPILDLIDLEFKDLFTAFIKANDDRCPDENYERSIRQGIYCKHGKPRQSCKGCRSQVSLAY